MIEGITYPYKTALIEANVQTKIEWGLDNGPITENAVLPIVTLFFENFVSI